MGGVLTGFAIVAFVIAVGYAAGRARVGGPDAAHALNRVAFFVANPALLFTVLAKADLKLVFSAQVGVAALSAVIAAALYAVCSRLFFRRAGAELTIGLLAAGYVNANNIGLPVAIYVLGDASYVAPILLLQLVAFAPAAMIALDLTMRGSVSVRAIASQPVRNPMILASILGVLVNAFGVRMPGSVLTPFQLIGSAAVPMVLMSFGMSLHGARPLSVGDRRIDVIVATGIKSVVMPAASFAVARGLFELRGPHLFAAVAIAALPTAQNVYNYANRFGTGEAIARDTVLLTTLAAVPVLLVVAVLLS